METNNPYESPEEDSLPSGPGRSALRDTGTGLLCLGLGLLVYGALGFWVFQTLPPNGGASGRLPSIYVMGSGILALLIGSGLRGMAGKVTGPETVGDSKPQVPTWIGVLVLLGILVTILVVIFSL